MKIAFAVILAAVGLSSISAYCDAPPARESSVNLDWDRFIKLWEDAHRKPQPPEPASPPVDYILSRCRYEARIKPGASEVRAAFELSVLKEKEWVKIPFLPASLALKEASLDGKAVSVAQDEGNHILILKGAGTHTLSVTFSISTPDREGTPQFSFPVVPTAITVASLTFPYPGLEVSVSPAQVLSSQSIGGTTKVQAAIPPTESIQVSWHRKLSPEKELPSKVYSRVEELVSVGESAVGIRAQFAYSILHSGIQEIRIRVPENAAILSVSGTDVQDWKLESGKRGQSLVIQLNRKVKGAELIQVSAELPLKNDPALEVPILRTAGIEREEGALAVEAKGNVEITLKEAGALRRVDVKELPQGLWSAAKHPLLYGFTITGPEVHLSLGIERHEAVPVLTSTVDGANAVTVLTKDGQWITRASFQVRNHLKQFIRMRLPEGSVIWSAFVSGQAVKPSKDADGQILIPLEKSMVGFENASFPVEVIYYRSGPALGLAGNRNVLLPKVDLPISEMLWSVYAPEDLSFLHFGGNIEKEKWARGIFPVSGLAGERMEMDEVTLMNSPALRDSKIKEAGKKIMGMMKTKAPAMGGVAQSRAEAPQYSEQAAEKQAGLEYEMFRRKDQPSDLESHVLPISFRIPETGRVYRFGRIMVIDSAPDVNMTYVRSEVVTGLRYVLLGLFLGFLYKVRARILESLRSVMRALKSLKHFFTRSKEFPTTA